MVRTRRRSIASRQSRSLGPAGSRSRYGASSWFNQGSYANGNVSADGSRKKSNGLKTDSSAVRSTSISNCRACVGEHESREVVAVGVLLPVDEVSLRRDLQRVAQDRRAAVRRGPQPDDVRRERDEPIVAVAGPM